MNQKTLMYSDWNNVISEGRNDLVFITRNKSYGAYQIRVNYNRMVALAFLISAGIFILAFTSPLIYQWIKSNEEEPMTERNIVIADPIYIAPDHVEPILPPAPPPPPLVQQIKFTPPVVVDKPLEKDEPQPLQEVLADKNIGTINNDIGAEEQPLADVVGSKGAAPGIFDFVQEMPSFPGGEKKLLEYISKNLNYPALARENGIQGRVVIRFVVDENGKVMMVNVPKGMGVGGGCDEEAMRVINTLPAWNPGKQNGHAVPVWFTVPVVFRLQ